MRPSHGCVAELLLFTQSRVFWYHEISSIWKNSNNDVLETDKGGISIDHHYSIHGIDTTPRMAITSGR